MATKVKDKKKQVLLASGVALASVGIASVSNNEVHADQVGTTDTTTTTQANNATNTVAKPALASAPVAPSSQPTTSTINIEVPHTNVDNAVNEAKSVGVQVTQKQTTVTTTNSQNVNTDVQNTVNDYSNQTKQIQQATQVQKQHTATYNQDTADANATNAANKAKIDQAVSELEKAGGHARRDTNSDKIVHATIDNYQSVKDETNKATNTIVTNLQKALAGQQTNSKVAQAENDHSALDQAVNNAKSVLGTDKVNKTATVNKGTVTTENADSITKAIRDDYSNQTKQINQTVQNYQNAKQAIDAIDKSELNEAVKNANETPGVKVIKDNPQTVTATIDNYNQKISEINASNKQQADSINSQVQQYKSELDKYKESLNTEQINPDLIKQELILGIEDSAEFSYKLLRNDISVKTDSEPIPMMSKHSIYITSNNQGNLNGDIIEITYTNLKKSSYKGKKISKIIAIFSNEIQDTILTEPVGLGIYSNPYHGFWYWNSSSITVNYKFYDEDNNLINFDNTDNSWITIGSLNSGLGRYEFAKLNSLGKAYSFKDSSVTIHNENTLYSDKANSIVSIIGSNWSDTTYVEQSNFPWGTDDWDTGLDNRHAYYGAGVFNITGSSLNITYGTKRVNNNNPGTWANMSTSIVKSNSGIVSDIHYKDTEVVLEKPSVSYHYNNVTPISIDHDTAKYFYTNIAVDKPANQEVSYQLHSLKYDTTDQGKSEKVGGVTSDGKTVTQGEDIRYRLDGGTIPKYRTDTVNSYEIVDKLDDALRYQGNVTTYIDFEGGNVSVTGASFDVKQEGNTVHFIANDVLKKLINEHKDQAVRMYLEFDTKVLKNSSNIENTGKILLNGATIKTNTTNNPAQGSDPEKSVNNGHGLDSNGKKLVQGDRVNYEITMDLSNLKNLVISDKQAAKGISLWDDYDEEQVDVSQADKDMLKATVDGKSVLDQFNVNWSNGALLLIAKNPKAFVTQYQGKKVLVSFGGKVKNNVSGTIYNKGIQNNFGVNYETNTVVNKVEPMNIHKDVVLKAGDTKSINNTDVKKNSLIDYKLESAERPDNYGGYTDSWSMSDTFDLKDAPTGQYVVTTDYDINLGNETLKAGTNISDYFNYLYDAKTNTVTITAKKSFLDNIEMPVNRKGKVAWTGYVQVKRIGSGTVTNTFKQMYNGQMLKSNEVRTFTYEPIDPTSYKDVTVGSKDGKVTTSDNNKTFVKGEKMTYILKPGTMVTSDKNNGKSVFQVDPAFTLKNGDASTDTYQGYALPLNHEKVETLVFEDELDKAIQYEGFKAFDNNGNDISNMFDVVLTHDNSLVQITAKEAYLDALNKGLQVKYLPELHIYATALKDNAEWTNIFTTRINGKVADSNKIHNNTPDINPDKEVHNTEGQDINQKDVSRGDILHYQMQWDMSGMKNLVVSQETKKKGVSFYDDYDEVKLNVPEAQKKALSLKSQNTNKNVTDQFNVSWDDKKGSFTITPKNIDTFLANFKGDRLIIDMFATVKKDIVGDIKNQAIQNNFGNAYETPTVVNHVPMMNPEKDVVLTAGDTKSINDSKITKGDSFDYRLKSSERPGNYGGVTAHWSLTDKLDPKDQITGDYHVYLDTDLHGADIRNDNFGTDLTLEKGTDITRYFNFKIDSKTNTVTVTANAEFLKLIDQSGVKANKLGWSAYVQTKRVGSGHVYNTFDENYNGEDLTSNKVHTFTFEPVIPDGEKDASIGHNDKKDSISINGMGVTKGDTISYQLKGQPLVQYHEPIKEFSVTDHFDEGVKYENYHAYLFTKDGKSLDVTNMLAQQIDGNTVQWTAKDELIKMLNSDEFNSEESVTPTIIAYAKVTADGIKNIENTYTLYINGKTDISNIVTNHTNDYKPSKSETVEGNDSNGKTVITNDKIKFDVAIDLKGLNQNTAISDEQLSKGLYVVDRLQDKNHVIKALAPEIEMQLTDSKGNVIKEWSGSFGENETKDQHVINLTLGEKGKLRDFLKKHGGQVLHLTYYAYVQDGKSGDITNQATVQIFGNNYPTNVTKNTVKDINPHKDIVVNAGDTASIDGSTVPFNSTYNYKLKAQELPANRATIVSDWTQTDKFDLTHVQPTNQWKVYTNTDLVGKDGKTIKANTDISSIFNYSYKDGVAVVTPKKEYIDLVNSAKNRQTAQSFSSYVQVKVIKAGWVYNTFVDTLNDDSDTSNKVKTFSFDPIIPESNKDGAIGETTSAKTVSVNGKRVTKGDTVTYILKGQDLKQYHEQVKTFSAVDSFDKGLVYTHFKAMLNQKDGKQIDVTSHIKDQVDGNTVTFVADDVLIKMLNSDAYNTVAGVTPTIYAFATVNTDDVKDKIDNSYWLNINGKTDISNIVEVTPVTSNPEKHETVSGHDSNGKSVTTNDVLNYDVTWDLSQFNLKDTAISDKQFAKGLSIDDTLTTSVKNGVSLDESSLQVKDAKGNTLNKELYTLTVTKTDTGFKFTVKAKDAKKFLETYGGQKLKLTYNVKVGDGVNGQISNIAAQNNFGQEYKTDTIKNEIKDINPQKDIVVNAGDTASIDGSTVPLNSTYNYKLESSELSDNRATVANKWQVKDKLDLEHVATTGQWKVLARHDLVGKDGKTIKAGTDISSMFDYNYKDGLVTITPKVDYLALVNSDKNRATKQGWDAYVQVKVIKAGWVSNTFNENFNDDEDKSNEVKTFSFDPVNPKGDKDVNSGKVSDNLEKQVSINGKQVVPGDTVSFQLKGQELKQYHETIKEFKAEDTLSEGLEYLGYKAFIVGSDGKQVDVTSMIKEVKSGKTVSYVGTEELNKLLNSDEYNTKAAETPTIVLYAKVAKDFNGKIDNNYKLYINGKTDISNTVEIENKTPNPVKDDKNEDGVDINGKSVPRGTTNVFTLHWNASQYKDAVATKDAIQKGFYYVDDYPDEALNSPAEFDIKDDVTGKSVDGFTTMNYASLEEAPKEIQEMLKANGIEVKGAFVVIKANDPQKFFDTYVKAGHDLSITLPMTLKEDFKSGSYKNKAYEIDFGEGYPTNEVENTVIKTSPDKDVVDDNGKSVKDKYVTAGDIMHYVGTWDLTEYKNFALTKDQIAKGLSIFDDYDENILEVSDLNKQALTIIDSTTNKAIDMSMVEVNWDDAHGKWTVSAKDPQKFLETYGGHALKINFFAKVKKDAKGDIKNKIVQNDFGTETETDVVTNHVSVSDPTKDVVVSLTDSHSLNNSKVKLGDTLYYKLGSKTREAGEAYDTTSWGFVDKLDITHDLYTGQALVKARYDIKLKDGSTIKAGDDITKYFDITYDSQSGEFKVMAKKEFLDIINSEDNKATKQGFDVYLQAKRIKSGDVENTAQEIYNGEVINTNTVKTHTDEPEKPKPEVPQVPQTPQTPTANPKAVETKSVQPELAKAPVQKASVLPQTGDSKDNNLVTIGAIILGVVGSTTLPFNRKRYGLGSKRKD